MTVADIVLVLAALFCTLALVGGVTRLLPLFMSARAVYIAADKEGVVIDGREYRFKDIEFLLNHGNYLRLGGTRRFLCEYIFRTKEGRNLSVSAIRRKALGELELCEDAYSEYAAHEYLRQVQTDGFSDCGPLRLYESNIAHIPSGRRVALKWFYVTEETLRIADEDEWLVLNLSQLPDAVAIVSLLREYYQLSNAPLRHCDYRRQTT